MGSQTKVEDNKKFAAVGFVSALAWGYLAIHWSSVSLAIMSGLSVIGALILLSVKK